MKGRKPIPDALKLLRGNPGRRPLNTQSPRFAPGIPDKPDWLGPLAAEEWLRLVADPDGQRVLTKADAGILVAICTCYEQWRECLAMIQQLGRSYTVKDADGNVRHRLRPEVLRYETALRQYVSFLTEIGFTPSSRSKIATLPEPPTPTGIGRFFTR